MLYKNHRNNGLRAASNPVLRASSRGFCVPLSVACATVAGRLRHILGGNNGAFC